MTEHPAAPRLAEQEVAAFLHRHLGEGVGGVRVLRSGEWSTAFAFDRAGTGYVVRFSTLLEEFAKDRVAQRYASPDLPVPRVVDIGETFDGYFAISERVEGMHLDHTGEAQIRSLLPALFAAIDAARRAHLSGTSGFGAWGADGHAAYRSWRDALLAVADDRRGADEPGWHSRISGWRQRVEASPTGAAPFDEAYRRLEALTAFVPDQRHLVHSDLLNYNVIAQGDRIAAVLDWGSSIYGDWLYDVAWLSFWSPWYPAWRAIDFSRQARAYFAGRWTPGLDLEHFDERLRCYELHIGLDSQTYTAYRGRWDQLDRVARHTLELSRASR